MATYKIMLVEDDNNLRAIYGDRLLAEGYEIVSARDGEEALAMAVKEKPNLIISDVMMPKISGFDMLDILRTTPETKDVKVIMMTALSQSEDKDRADKLGADKYLVKSQVTLEDVARVVHEVLGDQTASPAEPATPVADPTAPVAPVIADPTTVAPAQPIVNTDNTIVSAPQNPVSAPNPVAAPQSQPAPVAPVNPIAVEPLTIVSPQNASVIQPDVVSPNPISDPVVVPTVNPVVDPAPVVSANPIADTTPSIGMISTADPGAMPATAPFIPSSNDATDPSAGTARVIQPLSPTESAAPTPKIFELYEKEMATQAASGTADVNASTTPATNQEPSTQTQPTETSAPKPSSDPLSMTL